MAATMAVATGRDRTGRVKETHRLGSDMAVGSARTWHTRADAAVRADGSGTLTLQRDGLTVITLEFGPEGPVAGSPRTVSYRLGVGATLGQFAYPVEVPA